MWFTDRDIYDFLPRLLNSTAFSNNTDDTCFSVNLHFIVA